MKKYLVFLSALLPFVACQVVPVTEKPEIASPVFQAYTESDADTKTSIDPDFNVIWSSGDEVSIFAGSTLNQRYAATSYGSTTTSLEPAGSAGSGFFAGTEIPANVAVYPYGSGVTIKKSGTDGYVVSGLSIPAVQEYQAGTYANGAAPMVAVTSGAQDMLLKFRNSFGALNLRLRGDVSIKQIKVTGGNNEVLCGAFDVAVSSNSAPVLSMKGSGKEVILDCGGVRLDAVEPTSFYIVLPPVEMTKGFSVVITDTQDRETTITTKKSQTIKRNTILNMPTRNLFEGTVDLGLSVLWAAKNLGAETSESIGNYYAWGETQPKDIYTWSTNVHRDESMGAERYAKYCTRSQIGTVDNKTVLEPEDDAAHVNLGGQWRMPTAEEMRELIQECTWTPVNGTVEFKGFPENCITGYEVTGPSGLSIYLPLTSFMQNNELQNSQSGPINEAYYWTSSLFDWPTMANLLFINLAGDFGMSCYGRFGGMAIRPVMNY